LNYAQKSWNFSGKEAKMSCSVDLKREIFGKSVTDREEILAELFGIFIAKKRTGSNKVTLGDNAEITLKGDKGVGAIGRRFEYDI